MQSPGSETPTALIAVPDDAVDELLGVRLVSKPPKRRAPGLDAVLTIGTDSSALVTLTQAPATVYLLATWLAARARRLGNTITITGNRPSSSARFEVNGDEPPEVVANYLATALGG
jgi:hypothetical protein